jgi:Skp family chaperone for outer membrane proteins
MPQRQSTADALEQLRAELQQLLEEMRDAVEALRAATRETQRASGYDG